MVRGDRWFWAYGGLATKESGGEVSPPVTAVDGGVEDGGGGGGGFGGVGIKLSFSFLFLPALLVEGN